jgi:hypothetical protein
MSLKKTQSAIERFTSLFEPMIILVMGILIGALVLSSAAGHHQHQRCRGVRNVCQENEPKPVP